MRASGNSSRRASLEGALNTSLPEDLSRPVSYHNQWVMKGLPAWAHAGLPHGWTKTTHQSGLPIYYHRESRVVVLCKPYQLGNADLKTHKIPISAIPCMFRDALRDRRILSDSSSANSTENDHAAGAEDPQAPEAVHFGCLSDEEIRSYCGRKFKFDRIDTSSLDSKRAPRRSQRNVADSKASLARNGGSTRVKRRKPSGASDEKKRRRPSPVQKDGAVKIDNSNYTCQLHMLCTGRVGCCFSDENLPPLSAYPNGRYRVLCGFGEHRRGFDDVSDRENKRKLNKDGTTQDDEDPNPISSADDITPNSRDDSSDDTWTGDTAFDSNEMDGTSTDSRGKHVVGRCKRERETSR